MAKILVVYGTAYGQTECIAVLLGGYRVTVSAASAAGPCKVPTIVE